MYDERGSIVKRVIEISDQCVAGGGEGDFKCLNYDKGNFVIAYALYVSMCILHSMLWFKF